MSDANGPLLHALEQAEAMLRDLAPVLATYHRRLMQEGFTREEATRLVVALQRSLLGGPPQGQAGDGAA